jgi:hypothetical protein
LDLAGRLGNSFHWSIWGGNQSATSLRTEPRKRRQGEELSLWRRMAGVT